MKYAVSAQDIQSANHLATGNVHERVRLKIPFTAGKPLPEENEEEVMAALRRLALAKFKGVRTRLLVEVACGRRTDLRVLDHGSAGQRRGGVLPRLG